MYSPSTKRGLLGIDISSSAIKLVELKKKKGQYHVESYAVAPLPEGAASEDVLNMVEPTAEVIKKTLKDSRTKLKQCALAVPASVVINKRLSIPAELPESEYEPHIRLEAEQYIPYPIEEVHLDFEVQGASAYNPNTLEVVLVATRQENVDMRVAAAEMAGLKVELVDVESYVLERVIRELPPTFDTKILDDSQHGIGESSNLIALVDFGATMSNMVVFENNTMVFSQEHAFGGKQLTSEIMQRYGLSWEQAGAAKKQGDLPESYTPEVLEPFKERMTQQVSRFLQLFYASGQHNQVDKLLLAGGTALIPGIEEQIQNALNIPTLLANPFTACSLSNKVNPKRFSSDIPALLVAAGLSLRGLDHG
ncbi:MAG: type IV pilus assembly protein PilM [bacterium]